MIMKKNRILILIVVCITGIMYFSIENPYTKSFGQHEYLEYDAIKIKDSLDVKIQSVELGRASFYIVTNDSSKIRIDAYDYLDYRNKDYSTLIRPSFKLLKKVNNDTLWINDNSIGERSFIIIDSI